MTQTIEVEIIEKSEWDESLHPRDEHGRFGSGGGGGSKPAAGGAKTRGFGAPSLEHAQAKLRNPKGVKSEAVITDIQAAREKVYELHRASGEAGTRSSASTSRFNSLIGDLHEAETMAASLPDTIHADAPMSRETKDTLSLLSHRLAGIDMDISDFEEKASKTPHAELEPGYLARAGREVGLTPQQMARAHDERSAREASVNRLGVRMKETRGGQLAPVPRFNKLKPNDKANVEAVMDKHQLGPLKGTGSDREDFKQFNVANVMNAVRDAYRAGNAVNDPMLGGAKGSDPPDQTLNDINRVHLRFDALAPRNSDQLDFKEHHVENVREALTSAYHAGVEAYKQYRAAGRRPIRNSPIGPRRQ